MGYMHIDNLYKSRDILLFKTCFAMEKIHGTSAHISWDSGKIRFFSGGVKLEDFVQLFDENELRQKFIELDQEKVTVYGEAYGGKCQGMSKTYGLKLAFIAFEVRIGDSWLSVPQAKEVVTNLGLVFVPYQEIPTDIDAIDRELHKDSVVAVWNGMGEGHKREGIVLRPPIEMRKNNGKRIIAKYKHEDFSETKKPRPLNAEKIEKLTDAQKIAEEWITPMRLNHVLDSIPAPYSMEQMGLVINAMTEDVFREGKDELVETKEVRKAIGAATVLLFKRCVMNQLGETK